MPKFKLYTSNKKEIKQETKFLHFWRSTLGMHLVMLPQHHRLGSLLSDSTASSYTPIYHLY